MGKSPEKEVNDIKLILKEDMDKIDCHTRNIETLLIKILVSLNAICHKLNDNGKSSDKIDLHNIDFTDPNRYKDIKL